MKWIMIVSASHPCGLWGSSSGGLCCSVRCSESGSSSHSHLALLLHKLLHCLLNTWALRPSEQWLTVLLLLADRRWNRQWRCNQELFIYCVPPSKVQVQGCSVEISRVLENTVQVLQRGSRRRTVGLPISLCVCVCVCLCTCGSNWPEHWLRDKNVQRSCSMCTQLLLLFL